MISGMVKLVFNIIISIFWAVFLIWIMISKNKAVKKIEKEKGEIVYIGGNKVWEMVYFILSIGFLVFVAIDIIIEKLHSISPALISIGMLNVINLFNLQTKCIITISGIGFGAHSNRLTKFIQWDSIKEAHWNKYEPNILSITYIYLDSVKDEELKFDKKELEKIRAILEKYIEIN